jgi:hypothetical protein
MSPADLGQVVRTLTTADAARALDGLAQAGAPGDPARALELAWESRGETSGAEPHQALARYIQACRSRPEQAGPTLAEAVRALTHLERLASERGQALIEALLQPGPAALYREAGAASAGRLAVLQAAPPGWLAAVSKAILQRGAAERSPAHGGTLYGGAFLLLRFLAELPAIEAEAGWPEMDGIHPERLLRFLALLKCLGRRSALGAFQDPLLRDLFGLPPRMSPEHARRWQRKLAPERLSAWLFRATGTGDSDLLALARTGRGRRAVAVLLDARRNAWLAAFPLDRQEAGDLAERLSSWLEADRPQAALLLDPTLPELRQTILPVMPLDGGGQAQPEDLPGRGLMEAGELRERLQQLPGDLEHLSLPPALRGPRRADLLLSAAAQWVLRQFSASLPGFARAGLPYIFANFLDFRASLELEPGGGLARLGRPPLSLILNITGLARSEHKIPWLDDFHLRIYPEE